MTNKYLPLLFVTLLFIACGGKSPNTIPNNDTMTNNVINTEDIIVDDTSFIDHSSVAAPRVTSSAPSSPIKQRQTLVIDVETLKPPTGTLAEMSYDAILKNILGNVTEDKVSLVAHDRRSGSLVDKSHPFFNGMYKAYADHRPFVLSPEAVWLLICQGFSQHVNNNAEELRPLFVDFEGKKELQVYADDISLDNPNSPWEKYFPLFTQQIAKYTGKELIATLNSDFSTSTPTTRTASQITVMAAMKNYFSYTMFSICGIPKVILEGTPDDWQRIIDGVQFLRQYKLAWWVDEMMPVLKKIKQASEGEVDKEFWKNMFKKHTLPDAMCGDPSWVADGWVVKFYPYDDNKHRNNLKKLDDGASDLPRELSDVPMKFKDLTDGSSTDLTLWAGFVGLSQDPETFALKPEIGWFITKEK